MCIPNERMVIHHNGHELRIPGMTLRLFGEASTHVVCQFISPRLKMPFQDINLMAVAMNNHWTIEIAHPEPWVGWVTVCIIYPSRMSFPPVFIKLLIRFSLELPYVALQGLLRTSFYDHHWNRLPCLSRTPPLHCHQTLV